MYKIDYETKIIIMKPTNKFVAIFERYDYCLEIEEPLVFMFRELLWIDSEVRKMQNSNYAIITIEIGNYGDYFDVVGEKEFIEKLHKDFKKILEGEFNV